jgi:hypothetical protein
VISGAGSGAGYLFVSRDIDCIFRCHCGGGVLIVTGTVIVCFHLPIAAAFVFVFECTSLVSLYCITIMSRRKHEVAKEMGSVQNSIKIYQSRKTPK